MRSVIAASAALACLLAGEASAEAYSATGARLEYVAAQLTIIPEDRANIDVAITAGSTRLPTPSVRVDGARVVIDGGLRNRLQGCQSGLMGESIRIRGIGNIAHSDLPRIVIRTPRMLDVSIGGAVFSNVGASNGGMVAHNGCGDTHVADVSGDLQVALNGSGDVDVTRVSGALDAALNGSGSLAIERTGGDAELRLNGSGDLRAGPVSGDVDAVLSGSGGVRIESARSAQLRLNGSGDVDIGAVAGAVDGRIGGSGGMRIGSAGAGARLTLAGSGDMSAGSVRGALRAELSGSGSIQIASVEGQSADLSQSASGEVIVRGGRVERLNVRNSGSGAVRFDGVAGASSIEVRSSGDVIVGNAGRVEQLIDTGSGGVRLGT